MPSSEVDVEGKSSGKYQVRLSGIFVGLKGGKDLA
jgi:hypothetical protein